MRKLIYILFPVIILFSCDNTKTNLFAEYISQFKESIRILENTNNEIYSEFDYLLFMYQTKVEPYCQMTSELKNNKISIFSLIDSILDTRGIMDDKLDKRTQLNKQEIEIIGQSIDKYRNTLVLLVKDSLKYPEILDRINTILTTQKLSDVNAFKSKSVSMAELLACFYKLKTDIFLTENVILTYLLNQIDTGSTWYSHVEAFVVPDSEILPAGFPYRAEIFLAACDTTKSVHFEIEGKRYEVISGVGIYKCRITGKPGLYEKNGDFIIQNLYTGKNQKIPFKIAYEVLGKK